MQIHHSLARSTASSLFEKTGAGFFTRQNKTPVKPTCCQGLTGVSVKRCDPLDSSAY